MILSQAIYIYIAHKIVTNIPVDILESSIV